MLDEAETVEMTQTCTETRSLSLKSSRGAEGSLLISHDTGSRPLGISVALRLHLPRLSLLYLPLFCGFHLSGRQMCDMRQRPRHFRLLKTSECAEGAEKTRCACVFTCVCSHVVIVITTFFMVVPVWRLNHW